MLYLYNYRYNNITTAAFIFYPNATGKCASRVYSSDTRVSVVYTQLPRGITEEINYSSNEYSLPGSPARLRIFL